MREAFCATCNRSVYLASDDDDACPVCSSPLVIREAELSSDSAPGGAFDRFVNLVAGILRAPTSTVVAV